MLGASSKISGGLFSNYSRDGIGPADHKMRSLPMKSEVTQGVKMRESFPVRPAEDLCCSGTHHQQLAPIPTLQLLLAASLPCSGVATSRPALCMSGKPVLTSEIQRTP